MSTVVAVTRSLRALGLDTFVGVTASPYQMRSTPDGLELAFDEDLTAVQVEQVREVCASTSDADLTARANLRTLRDAAATGDIEAIRALVLAVADYTLGEAT